MRFGSLFTTAFSLAAYSTVVVSGMYAFSTTLLFVGQLENRLTWRSQLAQKSGENNGPGIVATAAFPDANIFNRKPFCVVARVTVS